MKNKKNVLFSFVLIALCVTTFFGTLHLAYARTYLFVNTSGQLSSIEAENPQEALRTAYHLGLHSGVMLMNNTGVVEGQGNNLYQFINSSGQLSSIRADSAEEALRTAYRLGLHSGVILVK